MNCHFKDVARQDGEAAPISEPGFHPKELFVELSEGILAHYEVSRSSIVYDVYQHFMDYWAHNDAGRCISHRGGRLEGRDVPDRGDEEGEGWASEQDRRPRLEVRPDPENPDRRSILCCRARRDRQLAAELESVTASIEELEEEEGGGGGGLAELVKVNRSTVTSRLKEIKDDLDATEERAVLRKWLELNDRETKLKKDLKDAEAALDKAAYERYPKLDEAEMKTLVVQDKWMAAIHSAIRRELESISHSLTQRVSQLAERYGYPFAEISTALAESQARVDVHLKQMGFGA